VHGLKGLHHDIVTKINYLYKNMVWRKLMVKWMHSTEQSTSENSSLSKYTNTKVTETNNKNLSHSDQIPDTISLY
jgi:hypothetical protein